MFFVTAWNTVFYEPLYNALVFLANVLPGADIGFAIIILTILVKLLIAPLSYKSIVSQMQTRKLQPLIDKIKEQVKDRQEQSKKIFELYKEKGINPFSGCLLIIVQIPIILALYQVFLKGIDFPELLYGAMQLPETLDTLFLGIVDLTAKSWPMGILAGLSQFVQIMLSPTFKNMANQVPASKDGQESFSAKFTKGMQTQMKYGMPIIIAIFAAQLPAAVALYWITTNLFTIIQELVIKRRTKKLEEQPAQ